MTVIDNTAVHRFELDADGHLAYVTHRRDGERLVLVHTEVSEALRGRGLGEQLVEAAVDVYVTRGVSAPIQTDRDHG